jgi:cullin 4
LKLPKHILSQKLLSVRTFTYFNSFLFPAKPALPDNFQEKTWKKLREAVIAIQTSKAIAYSLEELYKAVENLCSHKMDAQLYVNLTQLIESHVKDNVKQFLGESGGKLVSLSFFRYFSGSFINSLSFPRCI